MIEYKIGEMVKSLAGHDKDSYYMIIGKEGEFLLLADGRLKTIEKPKKKKTKHVQLVHSKTDTIGNLTNEYIKHEIKQYLGGTGNVKD